MNILIVFGTRPEIIKLYPVYKELLEKEHEVACFYTGQHSVKCLKDDIFDDFDYKDVTFYDKSLNTLFRDLTNFIKKRKIDCVLIQGDTWSCLYGALAAKECGVKSGHVEAGLRSFDETMIEEKIRIMVDSISDFLFAPTEIAKENIKKQLNINPFMVGNTIADILKGQRRWRPKGYILATLHRPETVDNADNFNNALWGLSEVGTLYDWPVYFYAHPRSLDKMKTLGIRICRKIHIKEAVGYQKFMQLVKEANLIATDSGGLQEEAAILEVPCITLRTSTERPETVMVKKNILCGHSPDKIVEAAKSILKIYENEEYGDKNLYGTGIAGRRIVAVLEKKL